MNTQLKITQDWKRDGYLVIENAKTIDLYMELNKKRDYTPLKTFDMFCAFTNEQFEQERKYIRPLKEGEKYVRVGNGIFGTKDGVNRWLDFCNGIREKIRTECDPQEIYLYEYNNHEGCINLEGDKEAIERIAGIWGWDEAKKIRRMRAMYTIEELEEET